MVGFVEEILRLRLCGVGAAARRARRALGCRTRAAKVRRVGGRPAAAGPGLDLAPAAIRRQGTTTVKPTAFAVGPLVRTAIEPDGHVAPELSTPTNAVPSWPEVRS